MAMLNVGHWDGSSGLDWVVWLEEYDNLALLVSDLGKDLVGAATQLGLAQSADYFHESRWFDSKLLEPLSQWEERARQRYWEALDGATRPDGPGRRLSESKVTAAWQEAELRQEAFCVAVKITDRLCDLYELVNPDTGRLWTRAEADVVIDEMLSGLQSIAHSAAKRAARHLRSHRHRYAAGLVMIDLIGVDLRPGSTWSHRSVLNGLIHLWALSRQLADPDARPPDTGWLANCMPRRGIRVRRTDERR